MNYYNEFDPKAAAWLRELIAAGLIPDGEVDERSITEIKPHELTGFTQCHFFAGIGGWSRALELAGWPATRPVWTGSCPCQPFSNAGKRLGASDDRHLWPDFFGLIRECRPEHVFGEQVASAIGQGWLDGISADLESEGYACGAAVLGAHSVGAPHRRQRIFWVANARHDKRLGRDSFRQGHAIDERTEGAVQGGCGFGKGQAGQWSQHEPCDGGTGRISRLADSISERGRGGIAGEQYAANAGQPVQAGGFKRTGFWSNSILIPCRDGKSRRIEPTIHPLANGFPARVAVLRGFGNAIVPQAAAEFIASFLESA